MKKKIKQRIERNFVLQQKIPEEELPLPLLISQLEKGKLKYFVIANPFEIYQSYSEESPIPVFATPLNNPLLLISDYEGVQGYSLAESCDADENILWRHPKTLDPLGYEAKKYIIKNEEFFGDFRDLAYFPGDEPMWFQPLDKAIYAVQIYKIRPKETKK